MRERKNGLVGAHTAMPIQLFAQSRRQPGAAMPETASRAFVHAQELRTRRPGQELLNYSVPDSAASQIWLAVTVQGATSVDGMAAAVSSRPALGHSRSTNGFG